ncbi:MAG: ASCH domain-containing protein [Verrucomicrobiota bacterium]
MKCISIRQPWAWLICAGLKDIENRSWPTKHRGPVAIHAGKLKPSEDELRQIEREFRVKIPREQLQYGGVIGLSNVTDCVSSHRSKWFFGDFGFVLSGSRFTAFRPMPGKLGFFNIPQNLD